MLNGKPHCLCSDQNTGPNAFQISISGKMFNLQNIFIKNIISRYSKKNWEIKNIISRILEKIE